MENFFAQKSCLRFTLSEKKKGHIIEAICDDKFTNFFWIDLINQ